MVGGEEEAVGSGRAGPSGGHGDFTASELSVGGAWVINQQWVGLGLSASSGWGLGYRPAVGGVSCDIYNSKEIDVM